MSSRTMLLFVSLVLGSGSGEWTKSVQLRDTGPWISTALSGNDGKYQFVALMETAAYLSDDYGSSWSRIPQLNGENITTVSISDSGEYMLAYSGHGDRDRVFTSSNFGNSWNQVSFFSGKYAIDSSAMSSDGKHQWLVGYHVHHSSNYGVDWEKITFYTGIGLFGGDGIATSGDGSLTTFVARGPHCIIYSGDSNSRWHPIEDTYGFSWQDVAMSVDGKYQTAVNTGTCECSGKCTGHIYWSHDYGKTWTKHHLELHWRFVAVSDNGQYQTAVAYGLDGDEGGIYHSDTFGRTWAPALSVRTHGTYFQGQLSMTNDGKRQLVGENGYVASFHWNGVALPSSPNLSPTPPPTELPPPVETLGWRAAGISGNFVDVAMSDNGRYQTAVTDTGGVLYRSTNYGVSWDQSTIGSVVAGQYVGWKCVAVSDSGQYQIAVHNTIERSDTYGFYWVSVQDDDVTSDQTIYFNDVAMSADGRIQMIVGRRLNLISEDYGKSWAPFEIRTENTIGNVDIVHGLTGVAMSTTGDVRTVVSDASKFKAIFRWTIETPQWTRVTSYDTPADSPGSGPAPMSFWTGVAMSGDGQFQTAISRTIPEYSNPDPAEGFIYRSADSGQTWVKASGIDARTHFIGIDISTNGMIQTAVAVDDFMYKSTDRGENWKKVSESTVGTSRAWAAVALSSDGLRETAVASDIFVSPSGVYTSTISTKATTFGPTLELWEESDDLGNEKWMSVAMNYDGSKQTAVQVAGFMYQTHSTGAWAQVTDSIVGGEKQWASVAMDASGEIQTAVTEQTMYEYANGAWTQTTDSVFSSNTRFTVNAISTDGSVQLVAERVGHLYEKTQEQGWTKVVGGGLNDTNIWIDVALSSDGAVQTAVEKYGIYEKQDGNWQRTIRGAFKGVAMNLDGTIQTAVKEDCTMYERRSYDGEWVRTFYGTPGSFTNGFSVSMIDNGFYQMAVCQGRLNEKRNGEWGEYTVYPTTLSITETRSIASIALSKEGDRRAAVSFEGPIYNHAWNPVSTVLTTAPIEEVTTTPSTAAVTYHTLQSNTQVVSSNRIRISFSFNTSNGDEFTVGSTATANGHIHYQIRPKSPKAPDIPKMHYSMNPVTLTVVRSDTVRIKLVDTEHNTLQTYDIPLSDFSTLSETLPPNPGPPSPNPGPPSPTPAPPPRSSGGSSSSSGSGGNDSSVSPAAYIAPIAVIVVFGGGYALYKNQKESTSGDEFEYLI